MQIQQEPLTDAQSSAILEIIGEIRKRQYSLKLIIEAIFWINRTVAQWRNLDSKFPKWQLVYYYFRKFVKDGRWQKINPKDGLSNEPFLGLIFSDDWITIERKPYNLRKQ
jgi:hypothetical protein